MAEYPDPGELDPRSLTELRHEAAESLAAELEGWWQKVTREDLMMAAPKAVEYGSADLEDLGRAMASMLGIEAHGRAEYVELACLFYLQGKVSRAIGAWRDGRRPSDDTYTDTTVYTMMIRRAREAGGWPR